MDEYRRKTLDPNFKGAVLSSMDEVAYLNKKHVNARVNGLTYHNLKESIFTSQVAMFFQKNSYLTEAFDQKIKRLKSNGLINYWISQYIDFNYLNVKQIRKAPDKLNLPQLLGGFQIWFCGICVSSIAFIAEVIVRAVKKSHESHFTQESMELVICD